MHLTPDILAAGYEYLRLTAPFNKWKLPPSDEVGFFITNHKDRFGHFYDGSDAGKSKWPHIAVSRYHTKDTPTLLAVIAHEMCHMRLSQYSKTWEDHGMKFKQLAKTVCRNHGFSLSEF
jgi:hypothetical protein